MSTTRADARIRDTPQLSATLRSSTHKVAGVLHAAAECCGALPGVSSKTPHKSLHARLARAAVADTRELARSVNVDTAFKEFDYTDTRACSRAFGHIRA